MKKTFEELARDLAVAAEKGMQIAQASYYNPKEVVLLQEMYIFYVYIQPVLAVISLPLLIILHRLLWGEHFLRKYGFMFLYTCTEFTIIMLQNAFYPVFLSREENYIEYAWCTPFRMATQCLPFIFYSLSQWVKVGQACQRFLIVYLPVSYKAYFIKRNLIIFIAVVLLVNTLLATLLIFNDKTEKVVTIDKSKMESVEICRMTNEFTIFDDKEFTIQFILKVVDFVLNNTLPAILMVVFSIGMIIKLRKQAKFRQRFQGATTGRADTDRLLKVVAITTVFFVVATIPHLFETYIIFNMSDSRLFNTEVKVTAYLAFCNRILANLSIPITFFLFAMLSADFRETTGRLCRCLSPLR